MSTFVDVEGDEIVIRVPIDAIPTAAVIAFDRALGFGNHSLRIENARRFAYAMADALRYEIEPETGSTMVDRALDEACLRVLENGGYEREGLAGDP